MNYNSIIIKIMNNGTRKKINKEFNDLTEAKCEAYLELSKVSKIENLDKVKSIILDNDLNLSNLKIMIKATVYPYDQYNIIKKCDDIEKEINYTYNNNFTKEYKIWEK